MISRRQFLTTAASVLLVSPLVAEAQQVRKVYRIGFLRSGPPPKAWVDALQQGLRELGYVEGQNVIVEFRVGSVDELPRLAEELVRMKVDVILASGGPPPILAAKKATTSVPIVFAFVSDPVELGLIRSLAHPEGNATGLAGASAELNGKRLELLRELVPRLKRVGVLRDPANPASLRHLRGAEAAARTLGLQLHPMLVQNVNDIESAVRAVRWVDGLLILDSVLFTTHRARLAELVATRRLPAIYPFREVVEVGGLMAYGPDFADSYRQLATYLDKIFKNANPGDLPVEFARKFEFVINAKTAKALGLTIPPSVLLRADQLIE